MKPDRRRDLRGQFIDLIGRTVESLPCSLSPSEFNQPNSMEPQDDDEIAWRLLLGRVEVLLVHNRLHSPEKFRIFFCIGRPSAARLRYLLKSLLEANFYLSAHGLAGYCLDADGNIQFSESFALGSTSPKELIESIEGRHASALLLQDEFEAHAEPIRRQ